MKTGIELIAEERQRQIDVEGWTPEHDDTEVGHQKGELATAAACYTLISSEDAKGLVEIDDIFINRLWPWQPVWWKPTSDIRNLVKAGALIAAEIDRLQRVEDGK